MMLGSSARRAVSVVIPCRNAESFLSETIASVLAQTHKPAEIIVVDDGSTDRSKAVAASFGGIVRVIGQAHSGVSSARNRGTAEATGAFVAYLDADDWWHPRKIEAQIRYLEEYPEVGAVTCGATVKQGDVVVRVLTVSDAAVRAFSALDMLATPRLPAMSSTWLIESRLAKATSFPVGVSVNEDVIHSALLRSKAQVGAVEESLAVYRSHPSQRTKGTDSFITGLHARLAWAQQHYQAVGALTPRDACSAVLSGAAHDVMSRYWSRDLSRYRTMRRELREVWPPDMPFPLSSGRIAWPVPVLRLKDALDAAMTRLQS